MVELVESGATKSSDAGVRCSRGRVPALSSAFSAHDLELSPRRSRTAPSSGLLRPEVRFLAEPGGGRQEPYVQDDPGPLSIAADPYSVLDVERWPGALIDQV